MTNVFFLGFSESKEYFTDLLRTFRGKLTIGGGKDLRFLSGPSILVLGNDLPHHPLQLSADVTVILESSNMQAASLISGQNVIAITCGTDPRATLSLASLCEGNVLVSLQRSIFSLSGEKIEPTDVSVPLSGNTSVFSVLVFCSLVLLLGTEEK